MNILSSDHSTGTRVDTIACDCGVKLRARGDRHAVRCPKCQATAELAPLRAERDKTKDGIMDRFNGLVKRVGNLGQYEVKRGTNAG